MIDDNDILRRETSMLDTLTDMEVANTIMKTSGVDKDKEAERVHVLDKRYQELGMEEMTCLDHKSSEYKALADYLIKSSGTMHGVKYRLEDIFRIDRKGDRERFEKSQFAKLKKKDRRLLWHGSRTTNFGGILSQGLRIAPPEAPVNGYAFGKGVYLADISSKSAQYCQPGMSGNTGLLLLVEAELGKPMYEIPTGGYMAEEQAKKHGAHSTLGVGRTAPQGWKDGASIHKDLKGVTLVSSFRHKRCMNVILISLHCSPTFPKASATTKPPMRMAIFSTTNTSATMSPSCAYDTSSAWVCDTGPRSHTISKYQLSWLSFATPSRNTAKIPIPRFAR